MRSRSRLATSLAILATLGAASAASIPSTRPSQDDALRALDGEWIYVEDRTEGRKPEEQGPSMGPKFSMKVEEGAVVLNGHGSGHKDVRVALDGSSTEVVEPNRIARYGGAWKDGAFAYQVDFLKVPGDTPDGWIRREFRMTPDGLLARVTHHRYPGEGSVSLFRHPQDIPMPTPAKASIADISWLGAAWVGTRGKSSIEERWTPPAGGAMLGVSRTVSGSDKMSAFEFLRIVERDGGLVYVAQPNGGKATEFTLIELDPMRAVFVNPRHDYPQRIVYELASETHLSASIGHIKGGAGIHYEYDREGS